MISEHVTKYRDKYLNVLHTGSRVICDPPPKGTDDDYIVLVHPAVLDEFRAQLQNDGWTVGGSPGNTPECNEFTSWKKAFVDGPEELIVHGVDLSDLVPKVVVNIILTCSDEFLEASDRATRLCKALNLLKKEDRITVFKALREDVWPEFI